MLIAVWLSHSEMVSVYIPDMTCRHDKIIRMRQCNVNKCQVAIIFCTSIYCPADLLCHILFQCMSQRYSFLY